MENLIKKRLHAKELQIGAWLGMGSGPVAEITGRAGFDWCMIDGEHGVNDLTSLRDQLVALSSVNCPAAVRVADAQPWMLKQALDIGAQTVLVPMIDTPEQAQAMASAVRYAPQGTRGLAAGVVRASGYGAKPDYAANANAQTCLMVQAESRCAVENVDAIAAVDGVDCIFIGPSDLAADMGYLGESEVVEVQNAIEHVIKRTVAAGKAAAMFCLNPDQVGRYVEMGATFIAVASDVVTLNQSMRARVSELRKLL